jgi:hypothetical protein
MNIPASVLIEKAASGDASRPVLNSVYLRTTAIPSRGELLATNGRIAAIVPVLISAEDKAGYIAIEALKAARKGNGSFIANSACTMPDGQTFARPDMGNYPNFDAATPKGETKLAISLDPELLYQLAQAMGSERGVTLEFSAENHALRVRPCDNPRAENSKGRTVRFAPASPEALGLLMPIAKKA